ncbi:unnamed protein product [Caenorhabditis auriculariae]|uniref:Uncharacterized protein n=1 Tax=Caenorhabditis auriculariae TaxID=2777116 RepID=A0A8S1HVF7_9PELO|nr:unnamed protein product [Caenorhabditis auriculariae]
MKKRRAAKNAARILIAPDPIRTVLGRDAEPVNPEPPGGKLYFSLGAFIPLLVIILSLLAPTDARKIKRKKILHFIECDYTHDCPPPYQRCVANKCISYENKPAAASFHCINGGCQVLGRTRSYDLCYSVADCPKPNSRCIRPLVKSHESVPYSGKVGMVENGR